MWEPGLRGSGVVKVSQVGRKREVRVRAVAGRRD